MLLPVIVCFSLVYVLENFSSIKFIAVSFLFFICFFFIIIITIILAIICCAFVNLSFFVWRFV